MIVSLILFFERVGILSAAHAVMNVRTPQGSIAWAVSLVVIPYVAVPAYWVFGRSKFQGYVLARQADEERIDAIANEAMQGIDRLVAETEWGGTAIRGTEEKALYCLFYIYFQLCGSVLHYKGYMSDSEFFITFLGHYT